MSLAGNLEDLGLDDIMNIVNLNQKSGMLFLRSNDHEGLVVFRQGQVVRARSTCNDRFIGQILVEKGLVDERKVQEALTYQKEEGFKDRLGSILIRRFSVQPQVVEEVARNQIQEIMRDLAAWRRGPFSFEAEEDVDPVEAVSTQTGSLIIDSHGHFKTDSVSEIAPASELTASNIVISAIEPSRAPLGRRAVVVDDDPEILGFIVSFLRESRWTVQSYGRCSDALVALDGMYRTGERPLVVIDLIMPRMDGGGILGGIELIEILYRDFSSLPVLAVADYHNLEAERRVKSFGYSFLRKPRRSEIADTGVMRFFSSRLLQELERKVVMDETSCASIHVEEMHLADTVPPVVDPPVSAAAITEMRSLLTQLKQATCIDDINSLVLRMAAESMARTVLFRVKDGEVAAIGSCCHGSETWYRPDAENAAVAQGSVTIFDRIFLSRSSAIMKSSDRKALKIISDLLGRKSSGEFFLGPIVSGGKVVAILYGDNFPDRNDIGNIDNLEIFLCQAGLAMERVSIEQVFADSTAEAL